MRITQRIVYNNGEKTGEYRRLSRFCFVFLVLAAAQALPVPPIAAQSRRSAQVNATQVNAPEGVAIHGYDPVAYHSKGEATRGDEAFSYRWNDATWLFENETSRDAFADDPERYAPAYGGYCAWAMSNDAIADIDPERWTIEGGTLYLNYSRWTKLRFDADIDERAQAADQNWEQRW